MKLSLHTAGFIAALLFACVLSPASAQTAKNVRFLVGSPAGGSNDIFARAIGQRLTEALGQPVVVDNRPGAGGVLGTDMGAKAPPDGYTILMGLSTLAINPSMYAKLPYDAMKDLAPISLAVLSPNILTVHPSLPAKTVKEFIALAKARPGGVIVAKALQQRIQTRLHLGHPGIGAAQPVDGCTQPQMTQRRILSLIGEGMTNRQIAAEVHLAEKTVKNYVSNMLMKLGMSRRTEAAVFAVKAGVGRQQQQ